MRRLAIAAAAILALASGCDAKGPELGSSLPHVDPNHDPRWTIYKDAFKVRDSWRSGPAQLIPTADGCFLGVGSDAFLTATVPAVWTAGGDCKTPKLDQPVGKDPLLLGNISSLGSAVVGEDGTFVALGLTAAGKPATYQSFAVKGKPGAWWPPVTWFQSLGNVIADVVGPDAVIARPGGGFVAVGESGQELFAWSSDDGVSWTRSPMPIPDGMRDVQIGSAVAGPDGTIAVVGLKTKDPKIFQSQALAWYSTDRGATWQSATVPAEAGAKPMALVHDGKRFVALGELLRDGELSTAWALTSTDGVTWQREPQLEPVVVKSFGAATALSDGRIAAVGVTHTLDCSSVFLLGRASLGEEYLGCNGIPGTLVQLKDGRLAASMSEHLWLREPITQAA